MELAIAMETAVHAISKSPLDFSESTNALKDFDGPDGAAFLITLLSVLSGLGRGESTTTGYESPTFFPDGFLSSRAGQPLSGYP